MEILIESINVSHPGPHSVFLVRVDRGWIEAGTMNRVLAGATAGRLTARKLFYAFLTLPAAHSRMERVLAPSA
jgi:hypothetical protein